MTTLAVENLRVVYHDVISVLNGISLTVNEGENLIIIGANGAGKTTLLRAISGMIDFYDGDIIDGDVKVEGTSVRGLDATAVMRKHRLTYVMEDRPVFWYLTIEENLKAAACGRWDRGVKADMEAALEHFPVLRQLGNRTAGYLSGGEQQMLAIAMALMTRPRILLLDEPSLGLAPRIVEELFEIIQRLHQGGLTVVLVEQNAHAALAIGTRGYVMETGRVVLEGSARELLANEDVREFYLGSGEGERRSYRDAKRYKRRKRWL
jgi:branched-chain amino acid transport system ATP-binding protein